MSDKNARIARITSALDALPITGASNAEVNARTEAVSMLREVVLMAEEIGWPEPSIGRAGEDVGASYYCGGDIGGIEVRVVRYSRPRLSIMWWGDTEGQSIQDNTSGLLGLLKWLKGRMEI